MNDTPDKTDKLEAPWLLLFGAWLVTALSVTGSLFFSEVMEYAPCVLCWWQRVFMFPLLAILLLGLFPFDGRVVRYALPLSGLGAAVALYHTLLYEGVIPETISPCSEGASCTEVFFELGIISIPLLSFLAFGTISALLVLLNRKLAS
ncbi:MAG: disulfide bond formation protein B [Deltaproteobacteria bacterium]|nr:disulfide bond formation protein B [Deltaproteobacteria bacterium]